MVAFAISPKIWKFLWAPIVDLTLSLKSWYVIGAAMAGAMLIACGFVPASRGLLWLVGVCAFLAEVGTGFVTTALGGIIAAGMPDDRKGRAAGCYQLGGKLASGLGGGAGVWLLAHEHSSLAPAIALGAMCFIPICALLLLPDPDRIPFGSLAGRLGHFARDFSELFKNPRSLFVAVLVLMPIGISGISNFWSGVASEWNVSVTIIALMTGPMKAVAATVGCLSAGWLADQLDRRVVYLGAGAILALVSIALSQAPRVPLSFVAGSFSVYLVLAMGDAAFSALILDVIGTRNAASKYAILSALGNVPDVYMTSFSGFAHDMWGTSRMLQLEAAVSIVCVVSASAWIFLSGKRARRVSPT